MIKIKVIKINIYIHTYRGGLGQNFRPGNLTLIQAIPYTHNKFWNMDNPILAYLYDHHIKMSKSLVGRRKIIKGSLLNCTFTSLFLFFIFSNISVTPFFLVPVFFTSRSNVIKRTVFTLLQNNHLIAICLHIMLLFLLKWLKYPRFNKPITHTNILKQIF